MPPSCSHVDLKLEPASSGSVDSERLMHWLIIYAQKVIMWLESTNTSTSYLFFSDGYLDGWANNTFLYIAGHSHSVMYIFSSLHWCFLLPTVGLCFLYWVRSLLQPLLLPISYIYSKRRTKAQNSVKKKKIIPEDQGWEKAWELVQKKQCKWVNSNKLQLKEPVSKNIRKYPNKNNLPKTLIKTYSSAELTIVASKLRNLAKQWITKP